MTEDWILTKAGTRPDVPFMVRQSTLNSASECSLRAWFDINGRVKPSTGRAAAVGTGVHAGIEHYYLTGDIEHMADVAVEAYRHETMFIAADQYPDGRAAGIEEDTVDITRTIAAWQKMRDQVDWTLRPGRVVGVEVEWFASLDIDPHWGAKGTVDLVHWNPDTATLSLVDHKTTRRAWTKRKASPIVSTQAGFYAKYAAPLIAEELGIRTPVNVTWTYDIYVLLKNSVNFVRHGPYLITEEIMRLTDRRVEAFIESFDPNVEPVPNPSSALCSPKYCPAWDFCPYGGAADELVVTL